MRRLILTPYEIARFDRWDPEQRIHLLDVASTALLTDEPAPTPSAVLEATFDAVFVELGNLVEIETLELKGNIKPVQFSHDGSRTEDRRSPVDRDVERPKERQMNWRKSISLASLQLLGRERDEDGQSLEQWRQETQRIADSVLGPTSHRKAESMMDRPPQQTTRFLLQRALPPDFLTILPPSMPQESTQAAIDRIESIVFRNRT